MSPLMQNLETMHNWNGVIAPFSFKLELMQEFPHFDTTTDVREISNYLKRLTDYFENYGSVYLHLYVFEFKVLVNTHFNTNMTIQYTYENFCDQITYELDNKSMAPIPYCLECVQNHERPVRDKVIDAIEAEKVIKSMEESLPQ